MSDRILVVYATRYGSTQEVAEKVAAALRENGFQVDVQPARQVQDVAVVNHDVKASPVARKVAGRLGVDLLAVSRIVLY